MFHRNTRNSYLPSDTPVAELPPELWSSILSYMRDASLDTFFKLKQVSRLFNSELIKIMPDISWLKVDDIEAKDVGKRRMAPKYSVKDRHTAFEARTRAGDGDVCFISKVVVYGPSGAGKSTFWRSINTEGRAVEYYPSNIGVEFTSRRVQTSDNILNKLQIWDTAGAERYSLLSPGYIRASKAILFMFALDSRQSLLDLVNIWFKEVVGNLLLQKSTVVCYLVGLKVDKVKERAVTPLEGAMIAKRFNLRYFEASGFQYDTVTAVIDALKEDLTDLHTDLYFEANAAVKPTPPEDKTPSEGNSGRMCSVM